jgi:hypothetical protein
MRKSKGQKPVFRFCRRCSNKFTPETRQCFLCLKCREQNNEKLRNGYYRTEEYKKKKNEKRKS